MLAAGPALAAAPVKGAGPAAAAPAAPVTPTKPPAAPAAPTAPAVDSPVQSETTEYNVFSVGPDKVEKKIGDMSIKVTTANGVLFIDQTIHLPVKAKEMELVSEIIYRGGEKPVVQKGKLASRLGDFKQMEGTVVFTPKDGGFAAKEDFTGYADKEGKLLAKPVTTSREVPVPAGMLLTFPAILRMGPQLLPSPGQIDKVVYLRLPKDYLYPSFSEYVDTCVLVRGESGDDGHAQITLKQMFPGGNAQVRFVTTVDADGKVLEVRVPSGTSVLVYRPVAEEPAVKTPAPSKSAGGK
jgi:hypothetical protein